MDPLFGYFCIYLLMAMVVVLLVIGYSLSRKFEDSRERLKNIKATSENALGGHTDSFAALTFIVCESDPNLVGGERRNVKVITKEEK